MKDTIMLFSIQNIFLLITLFISTITWAASTPEKGTGESSSSVCGHDLSITKSTQLNPSCRYTGTTSIVGSGITLDCKGATLDAQGQGLYGLTIGGKGSAQDITVKNCNVIGAKRTGIFVGRSIADSKRVRLTSGAVDNSKDPKGIQLSNVSSSLNGRVGIYINPYVQNVHIDHAKVIRNGGVGIYVDHDSQNATISNSEISDNGHIMRREGIAIDSSQHNLVQNNIMYNNTAGGVFIYRNCGEQPNNPNQILRTMASSYNQIDGNTISGSHYGIWVASRQDRPVRADKCRLKVDPQKGVFADNAPNNTVQNNKISHTVYGINVGDDNNKIIGNDIHAEKYCLYLGSHARSNLQHPVKGISVTNNQCNGIRSKTVKGTEVKS